MTKTLLVSADLGHLKAYRLIQDNGEPGRPQIERIQTETTDATSHLSEVVTDQAGQFRKRSIPAGTDDRSDGEPHNLTLERRRRALKAIVRDISRLIAREKPQEWLLAAGKDINQRLVEALDDNARARLKKNVQANLTKLSSAQMLAHFHGEDVIMPGNSRKPASRSRQAQASRGRVGEYNAGSSERQTQDSRPTEAEPGPPVFRSQSWNRRAGRLSLARVNRSNVRRKPSARRTSPFKQMMRQQTISPAVAKAMQDRPEKGDKRRSVAQRTVTRSARMRISQRRTEGSETSALMATNKKQKNPNRQSRRAHQGGQIGGGQQSGGSRRRGESGKASGGNQGSNQGGTVGRRGGTKGR